MTDSWLWKRDPIFKVHFYKNVFHWILLYKIYKWADFFLIQKISARIENTRVLKHWRYKYCRRSRERFKAVSVKLHLYFMGYVRVSIRTGTDPQIKPPVRRKAMVLFRRLYEGYSKIVSDSSFTVIISNTVKNVAVMFELWPN